LQSPGGRTVAEHDCEERDDQENTDTLENSAQCDEDGGDDTLAAGKPAKISQKKLRRRGKFDDGRLPEMNQHRPMIPGFSILHKPQNRTSGRREWRLV
jgi:hypothetical protein